MPPTVLLATEYLEINDYPLANHCNRLLDLSGMWKVAYRTASIATPYAHGRNSYPTYMDELVIPFPGLLKGEVDSDGTPFADARNGLAVNYEEFYTAVLAPVDTGDGTRAVEWHKATGATWTGTVRVDNFDVRARDAGAIDYTLTLAFPAGRLTAP